jgi:exosortase
MLRPPWWLLVISVALAWYAVIRILWSDWIIDPQYTYGSLVPLLVIGLLFKRWEDRPEPSPLTPVMRKALMLPLIGAAILLMAVIPMAEANPDWRPLGAVASLSAVVLTLCLLTLVGGMSWLRHFAFPICFFLIATPWPRNFEQDVMSPLMMMNTGATLEILHWAGFEALSQGNLIVLPTGILGIEEACSGIRSLQSALMVSLFFGEIFRLSSRRRLILLGVALLAALAGNICRNALLSLIASSEGMAAVAAWHDRAGLLVFVISFGAVLGCAWVMKRGMPQRDMKRSADSSALEFPGAAVITVLILLASPLVLTESWFGSHERDGITPWSWNLQERQGVKGIYAVPIASTTRRMLFYPEGFSERWLAEDGAQGQVFYFQWPPGRTAVQAVTMHNPEVCLSSIGITLTAPLSPLSVKLGTEQVTFNSSLFDDHGAPVYVFHALIEQGALANKDLLLSDSLKGRVMAMLSGHRNHGQRMLEVAFWKLSNEQQAREALVTYLGEAVLTGSHPSNAHSVKP